MLGWVGDSFFCGGFDSLVARVVGYGAAVVIEGDPPGAAGLPAASAGMHGQGGRRPHLLAVFGGGWNRGGRGGRGGPRGHQGGRFGRKGHRVDLRDLPILPVGADAADIVVSFPIRSLTVEELEVRGWCTVGEDGPLLGFRLRGRR